MPRRCCLYRHCGKDQKKQGDDEHNKQILGAPRPVPVYKLERGPDEQAGRAEEYREIRGHRALRNVRGAPTGAKGRLIKSDSEASERLMRHDLFAFNCLPMIGGFTVLNCGRRADGAQMGGIR